MISALRYETIAFLLRRLWAAAAAGRARRDSASLLACVRVCLMEGPFRLGWLELPRSCRFGERKSDQKTTGLVRTAAEALPSWTPSPSPSSPRPLGRSSPDRAEALHVEGVDVEQCRTAADERVEELI